MSTRTLNEDGLEKGQLVVKAREGSEVEAEERILE
jgi:hypothetical protein